MKRITRYKRKKEGDPQKRTTQKSFFTHSKIKQKKLFYQYLYNNIATAAMVSNTTGIPEKNINIFINELEKIGLIYKVYRILCNKTGFEDWYFTTNNKLKINYLKTCKYGCEL